MSYLNKCGTNIYIFTLQRFGPSPSPNYKSMKVWLIYGPIDWSIDWLRQFLKIWKLKHLIDLMNLFNGDTIDWLTDSLWWLVIRLIDWLMDGGDMIDQIYYWLIDWWTLMKWFNKYMIDWLIIMMIWWQKIYEWLIDWMIWYDRLDKLLIDWMIDCGDMMDQIYDWLIDLLIDWLSWYEWSNIWLIDRQR